VQPRLVIHNSHLSEFRSPFGAVSYNETIRLRLKLAADIEPDSVVLRLWHEDQGEEKIAMTLNKADDTSRVYQACIKAGRQPGRIWYYFIIDINKKTYYYGNNHRNFGGEGQLYDCQPPSFQITVYKNGASTPNWFKDGIIYQIMPDRFYNGLPDGRVLNPKKGSVNHAHWANTPFYIRDPDNGQIIAYDFFGGNLAGVMAKLPYLKELGITVIYLNPIFASPSNHRYDVADYHSVDSMLGDNELFKQLCAQAAEYGISIILDGVFSHTGSDSIYFNREGNYPSLGAYQSQQSPYYKWYRFKKWPDSYESWWNVDALPNVNELEPSYIDFVIAGQNSVAKYWLNQGAKGWRLDVADELPAEFIKQFRQAIKETDPDAVLIGEVWEDASHKVSYGQMRDYFGGEQLDGTMNYPFRQIALGFLLGKIDAQTAAQALMSLYENYPRENFYAAMNLVGSHDVPRILTLLGEAPPADSMTIGEQARYKLPPEQRKLAVARLKLLALWQMTFPGVPAIYYGDEAGVEGYKDPFNRRTYPWGAEDGELIEWYKTITALRRQYDSLRTGEWINIIAEGEVYGYVRRIVNGKDVFGQPRQDNVLVVLLNRHTEKTVELKINVRPWCRGILIDILNDSQEIELDGGILTMTLQPLEGKLLIQKEEYAFARQCGVLLHPTSLPSRYGIGDLGKEAYDFINFLVKAKQKLWQILPLNPTGFGESPYQCLSAFAGNHMLISLGKLVAARLLTAADIKTYPTCDTSKIEFDKVRQAKDRLLRVAFANFRIEEPSPDYKKFVAENSSWLDDYAFFMALKHYFKGAAWYEWPKQLARRDEDTLLYYRKLLTEEIEYQLFLQYTFFSQWLDLKRYANRWGVKIIGDLPLFVAPDSSDVWANPGLFELDDTGRPAKVAGVPPDYFSKTGQLWGNPLYKWEEMAKDDYAWWRARFELLLKTVDIVRVDHFRGFEAFWAVLAGETTAINGQWLKGPGAEFFATMRKYLGKLPLIAEDLGIITPEVDDLKNEFYFPGMKVLHFVFESDEDGCVPVIIDKNSVVYTGTHDNNTTVGWYKELVADSSVVANCVREAIGVEETAAPETVCSKLVEYAYAGNADTAIIPFQDILELGSEHRMNLPGTIGGNWGWRCQKAAFTPELAKRLAELAVKYNR
jgi:4-alpha-glucanotransferase